MKKKAEKTRLKTIPVSAIHVEDRFRENFGTSDDKTGLKESIEQDGITTPITVEDLGDGSYRLLAGERRLTAAKELNHVTIDAKIFPTRDELERIRIEFGENFYRLNWTLEERVKMTKRLDDLHRAKHGSKLRGTTGTGWGIEDTARLMGRSKSPVHQDLQAARILELAPELAIEGSAAKIIKAGRKLIAKHERSVHAEQVQKRKLDTPRDKAVKLLCDSYILADRSDTLLRSGAADLITQVEANSIDFIEFDPPYGIGLEELRKHKNEDEKLQIYNEIPPDSYPAWLQHMLNHCYRALKPDSWLVLWCAAKPWTAFKQELNIGNNETATVFRNLIVEFLFNAGFDVICTIPGHWYKYTGQTMHPETRLANDYETFYYAGKGNPRLYRSWNLTYVYKKVAPQLKWHPSQRPIALMYGLINVFTKPGSLIMSPCLGSGSVILGADDHGCRCFGWDLERSYRDEFVSFVDKNYPGEGKKWSNL